MALKRRSNKQLPIFEKGAVTEQTAPRLERQLESSGPRVSVVMPTFRRARQIGASIESLLRGEWEDFELLVRDDGDGTDGTADAVRRAASSDSRVHYHRNERHLGIPGNVNAGIRVGRGDLIVICHDHDLYKPGFLSRMVEVLSRHPSALYVHCAIDIIDSEGAVLRTHVGDWPELVRGADWLKFMLGQLSCPVSALTMVPRRSHEQYGLYDSTWGFIADVEMWMRLALHGDVAYVREPLVRVRAREAEHEMSASITPTVLLARIHRKYLPFGYKGFERLGRRLVLERKFLFRLASHVIAPARKSVREAVLPT